MSDFEDAKATLRTCILSQMIAVMPPRVYDYLQQATDAAVDALLDPSISWALKAIHEEVTVAPLQP